MQLRMPRVLCRPGRHTWGPYVADDGPELMRTCSRCGKVHFSTRPRLFA